MNWKLNNSPTRSTLRRSADDDNNDDADDDDDQKLRTVDCEL